MTYDIAESSHHSGEPVELYKFVVGASIYTYTSSDSNHIYNSETYTPISISRSTIEQSDEVNRNELKVAMPRDLELPALFIVYPPAVVVGLSIFRYHPAYQDFRTVWAGRVISVEFSGITAEMHCEHAYSSLKRMGLRRHFQSSCPHVLYGVQCGVNQLEHQTSSIVSSISGSTIDVPAASGFANGYFNGGFIRGYTSTGLPDSRMITDHTGTTLTVPTPFQHLSVSDPVDLFPGCNHTSGDCLNKFNNKINFGGFEHMPDQNPFGGKTIF